MYNVYYRADDCIPRDISRSRVFFARHIKGEVWFGSDRQVVKQDARHLGFSSRYVRAGKVCAAHSHLVMTPIAILVAYYIVGLENMYNEIPIIGFSGDAELIRNPIPGKRWDSEPPRCHSARHDKLRSVRTSLGRRQLCHEPWHPPHLEGCARRHLWYECSHPA